MGPLKARTKCHPDSNWNGGDKTCLPFISSVNVKCRLHRCNHCPLALWKALLFMSDICMSSSACQRETPSTAMTQQQVHLMGSPPTHNSQFACLTFINAHANNNSHFLPNYNRLVAFISIPRHQVIFFSVCQPLPVCRCISTIKTSDIYKTHKH